jgi:hypothetical protein
MHLDFDFVDLLDDVIIRDDVAFRRDDDARAERVLHHRFFVRVAELPRIPIEKFKRIHLPTDRHLLRSADTDDGRNHTSDERAALPTDRIQGGHHVRFDARSGGQSILFRRAFATQIETAVLEAVVVQGGDPGREKADKQKKFEQVFHQLTWE